MGAEGLKQVIIKGIFEWLQAEVQFSLSLYWFTVDTDVHQEIFKNLSEHSKNFKNASAF